MRASEDEGAEILRYSEWVKALAGFRTPMVRQAENAFEGFASERYAIGRPGVFARPAAPADETPSERLTAAATQAEILACRAALAANAPADQVVQRLRAVEAHARLDPGLHAQWLVAAGVAINRLGVRGEALGALRLAADIFEELGDGARLAEAKRMVAVALAWRGEGCDAGLTLLRALAESLADGDLSGAALALIEAARLEMEMGRARDAAALFERALSIEGADIAPLERRRAEINQLQTLLAAGRNDEMRRCWDAIKSNLSRAPARLRFLAALELVRLAKAQGSYDAARRLLENARQIAPWRPEDFEAVEFAEAEAELAVARRDFRLADERLKRIVARCAEDDLAGREIKARLLHAVALDGLGRAEEAEQTLAAALRRAVARGLIGYADEARAQLAARGGSETVAAPSTASGGPSTRPVAQRFVRRRPLGEGGQGSVFRAYDLEFGGEVALKRFDLGAIYDEKRRERSIAAARTEFLAASRIDHPGVAQMHGFVIEPGGDAILIEELIEGPSLRKRMQSAIEAPHALDLVARIAFALAAVHAAGVVHCDLKPENVILSSAARPVIVDFGVALIGPAGRTGSGTPAYMAPEQARGGRSDARTDLFALGLIAHELLGVEPAAARKYWKLHDDAAARLREAGVDAHVARLIRRLVAPMKWMRPRSASDVGQSIARGL